MPVTIHNHIIDKLAVVAGIASGIALYPQILLIVTGTDKTGVSLVTYGVVFTNSIVWLFYSMHRGLLSLAIASILNIFGTGAVLVWYFTI